MLNAGGKFFLHLQKNTKFGPKHIEERLFSHTSLHFESGKRLRQMKVRCYDLEVLIKLFSFYFQVKLHIGDGMEDFFKIR